MGWSTTDVNAALGKTNASNIASASNKTTATLGTTDRGTPIVNANNSGFDKNSFLKILSAQLSNLDPTSNQDSTAYVTQMSQFAAMEQMYNLNDTMSTFAYQQLIGKGVTVDVADSDGNAYTGIVRGVSKDITGTYLSVEVNENGKNVYKVFDVRKLISVLGVPDDTNSNMLVNSDFLAASNLAADENNKVVIGDYDEDGNVTVIKGTIKSTFIDNGVVKVRVDVFDESGKPTGTIKVYPYGQIYKAGDLTDEDMDVKPEDIVPNEDLEAAKALVANKDNRALINDVDADGKKIYVKGTITEAFVENNRVKIKVDLFDDDNKPTGNIKTYLYSDIYKAGNLTDEEMNTKPPTESDDKSEEKSSLLNDSENNAKSNAESIKNENKTLEKIMGS